MTSKRTQHPKSLAQGKASSSRDRVSIAVVIVGKDCAEFIEDALQSLVSQTLPPNEILYYDDNSSDESIEIAKSYLSLLENFQIIKGEEAIGISSARNRANSLVNSDVIAVLDADDMFLDNTIADYHSQFIEHPDIDLIYADTYVFKHGSNHLWRMRYPAFKATCDAVRYLMISPVIPFKHSSLAYRRKAIDKIGGYREELDLKVDYDLFLRFLKKSCRIKKFDKATSHHRTHRAQISKDRIKGIFLYWQIIDRHESRVLQGTLYKLARALGEVFKLAVGR